MFDMRAHRNNLILDARAEDRFDAMAEVLPEGQRGVAKIDHFTMDPGDMIASMAEHNEDFVPLGTYARLRINGQLMMTDSPMEKRTNLEVVDKAKGRVLIAGLGLGMILRTILRKPEVTHVTVLEKYEDVIDLVFPSLLRMLVELGETEYPPPRLQVLCADVFEWEPPPGTAKYHAIYFDIWPNSNVGNLPEMRLLHKRYRPLVAKGGWMTSWTYDKLTAKERDDRRFLKTILPRKLSETLQREGGEKLAGMALKMLVAPGYKIDDQTKQAIAQWLREHDIQLQLKVDGQLPSEQEQALHDILAGYGVTIVKGEGEP